MEIKTHDKCDSEDLAIALGGNTKIVVTTIHKFYYILNNNLLGDLKNKKFAVLIDEAHSSTEGVYMQSVTNVLTNEEDEEEKTEEDKMLEEIQKSGKQKNVSMIAFTATPKPDTLQLFGTLNAEGKKESFDLYSMKQAIEEGYILNVLDNYVTWKTYCHINKATQNHLINSTLPIFNLSTQPSVSLDCKHPKTKNPRAGKEIPTLGNALFSSLFRYLLLYF